MKRGGAAHAAAIHAAFLEAEWVWRQHPDLWKAWMDSERRPIRQRPSEWAVKNITLDTGPRPGPWRNEFMPFTATVLDLGYDHPEKQGCIIIKPAQVGVSEAMMVQLVCQLATDPGPVLYMTTAQEEAKRFASSRFKPMLMQVPELAEQIKDGRGAGRRNLTAHFELKSGQIDFVGSGDERGAISEGRRFVYLDEYELASRKFPAASGELFSTARARMRLYRSQSWMSIFSHPRYWDQDLHSLYLKESDQGRWAWPCPHCDAIVDPTDWDSLIHFTGGKRRAEGLDPADATLVCTSCGAEITNAQRAKVCRSIADGGGGHRWTPLDAEEASKKRFVGCWVTSLSDPKIGIAELAAGWVSANDDESRQTWYNKTFGAPYRVSRTSLTATSVEECILDTAEIVVPGGEDGAQFVVFGLDVQMPRENPTLYFAAVAYSPTTAYVVDLKVMQGWSTYFDYLRSWSITRETGSVQERLELSGGGLDSNWETGQVLDNCRRIVHTAGRSTPIHQMGLAFNSKCHGDLVVADVPEHKCIDPTRPDLGMVDRKYLHRHTWMDRVIKRFAERRYLVLCQVPEDFKAHVTAQVATPLRKEHDMAEARMEWKKAKERRDDWHTALAYAEATAAIRFGLDRMHEWTNPKKPLPLLPRIGP